MIDVVGSTCLVQAKVVEEWAWFCIGFDLGFGCRDGVWVCSRRLVVDCGDTAVNSGRGWLQSRFGICCYLRWSSWVSSSEERSSIDQVCRSCCDVGLFTV